MRFYQSLSLVAILLSMSAVLVEVIRNHNATPWLGSIGVILGFFGFLLTADDVGEKK